jgi:hypothetical protein
MRGILLADATYHRDVAAGPSVNLPANGFVDTK